MSLWTRFTSWLSGWPQGAPRKDSSAETFNDDNTRESSPTNSMLICTGVASQSMFMIPKLLSVTTLATRKRDDTTLRRVQ